MSRQAGYSLVMRMAEQEGDSICQCQHLKFCHRMVRTDVLEVCIHGIRKPALRGHTQNRSPSECVHILPQGG